MEVMVASVIMGIMLVAGLRLFGNLGRSGNSIVKKEDAAFLLINMLEEIEKQDYDDPATSGDILGLETAEDTGNRIAFDDIDDYANWSSCPPEDRFGQPYAKYQSFTRTVAVRYVMADDFTQTAPANEGFKEVTITINDNNNEVVAERKFVMAETSP